jgi:hypothetical protein
MKICRYCGGVIDELSDPNPLGLPMRLERNCSQKFTKENICQSEKFVVVTGGERVGRSIKNEVAQLDRLARRMLTAIRDINEAL